MTTSPTVIPDARRVVVVHGFGASPTAHWFPSLARALTLGGIAVDVVALPSPDEPDADLWEEAVHAALGVPDEGTWIVAHSLGAVTALRVLASLDGEWSVGGLILVSGFTGPLHSLPELDPYLADDVDAEALVDRIATRIVIRSDADTSVPPAASDELAGRLDATLYVQPGAGHFLGDDGITELPLVEALVGSGGRRSASARRIELVKDYFRLVDAGDAALLDLYTDDVELYFPKFGVTRGIGGMRDFAKRMGAIVSTLEHDIDGLEIVSSGDRVVVEGREWGTTADGTPWPDGRISTGRFCNMFTFRGDLISSVHIYTDPDFASTHSDAVAALFGRSAGSL